MTDHTPPVDLDTLTPEAREAMTLELMAYDSLVDFLAADIRYVAKCNLVRHSRYLHDDGIEKIRSAIARRDFAVMKAGELRAALKLGEKDDDLPF